MWVLYIQHVYSYSIYNIYICGIYIYWLSHMYMMVYDIRSERMRKDGAFTLPCHLGSEFLSCPETLMACLVVALPASWESNDRCDFRASHPVTLKTAAKSRTAIEHLFQLRSARSLIWRFGWFGECFHADPANLTHDHKCYSDLKFKINLEEFEIPLLGIGLALCSGLACQVQVDLVTSIRQEVDPCFPGSCFEVEASVHPACAACLSVVSSGNKVCLLGYFPTQ